MAVVVAICASGTVRGTLADAARTIDRRFLGEWAMDSLSRWRGDENWANAEPLKGALDYGWLESSTAPLRIGHALGAAGTLQANRIGAMVQSSQDDIRVLELDLRLSYGRLWCAHDEQDLPLAREDDCQFERVIALLPPQNWLVLDLKNDFVAAGDAVVEILRRTGKARQVIFQLYRPEDLQRFNEWRASLPELPGPILSVYLAHRRVADIAAEAPKLGVHALTVPIPRLPALSALPPAVRLLVHPVHDCDAWARAVRAGASGVYTVSGLRCRTSESVGPA